MTADHDVLFLGCVVVTLAEVRVRGTPLQREAHSNGGVQFHVRATVRPTSGSTEERMGECADSIAHPLQNTEMAEELVVPVMLERASYRVEANANNTAETTVPSNSSSNNKNNNDNSNNSEEELRVELVLEVSIVRSSAPSVVARRTVLIESLRDVSYQNCGVATARVDAVALRQSEVWGHFIHIPGGGRNTSLAPKEDVDWSGVEVQFVVRALDISEPVRAMLAAECDAYALLRLPQRDPHTSFVSSLQPKQQQQLPYGALPLNALYHCYRRFYEFVFNNTLRHSEHVDKMLRGAHAADGAERRWNALKTVDLRPVLLGDDALAPVLATLFYCPSLCSLVLDQNSAGDLTCYRLAALFSRHRHLQEVSICRNAVHESGAEQLLRLARRNKRVTLLCAAGNPCSFHVLERMQRVATMNEETMEKDPYNVFSASYAYATSPDAFPSALVKKALAVWAMLSVAPVRAVAADAAVSAEDGEGKLSIIPDCALSPLLNEIMRTVVVRMSPGLPDPWIRMVFSDVESPWKTAMAARGANDNVSGADDNASGAAWPAIELGTSFADVEELYGYSFLHIVVVTMRGMARAAEWIDTAAVLRDIGKRQKSIGVMPEDYRDAVRVFLQSLISVCGNEDADAEHAAAFLQCLALGLRTAVLA
ncbi:hypothetical protein DQ04_02111000 [Trypanosoma grayi]|uniref:hypothetical protein n=1 Tax=Trypanosoma grayi TaxID=71804 RepID=UPI0004F4A06F|nr:hypothetical protein DQ04_02111000 [Trypanosoma grayi]KEG11958.1 hypothetical protein DQ04_02111000 [Trypanosoma grayi]